MAKLPINLKMVQKGKEIIATSIYILCRRISISLSILFLQYMQYMHIYILLMIAKMKQLNIDAWEQKDQNFVF